MATKPDNTSGFCDCHHECNNTSNCTWKYLNYDSDLHHGGCAVKYYNMEFLGVCGNCGKMVASDHDIKPGRRQCHTGTTDSKDDGLCQIDSANEHAKLLTTSKDKSTKVLLKQPITNREVVKTLADYRRTEKCSNSSEAKDFDWLKTKTVIDDVIALNQSADQCQQKESRGDNHECNEDAISSMLQDDNTSKCKGNDTPSTLTDKCTSDITDKGVKNGDIIDEFVRTGDITVECVQTSDITTECVKTSDITAKCVPVQTNDITAKCVQTNGITAKCVQTNDITAKCVQTSDIIEKCAQTGDKQQNNKTKPVIDYFHHHDHNYTVQLPKHETVEKQKEETVKDSVDCHGDGDLDDICAPCFDDATDPMMEDKHQEIMNSWIKNCAKCHEMPAVVDDSIERNTTASTSHNQHCHHCLNSDVTNDSSCVDSQRLANKDSSCVDSQRLANKDSSCVDSRKLANHDKIQHKQEQQQSMSQISESSKVDEKSMEEHSLSHGVSRETVAMTANSRHSRNISISDMQMTKTVSDSDLRDSDQEVVDQSVVMETVEEFSQDKDVYGSEIEYVSRVSVDLNHQLNNDGDCSTMVEQSKHTCHNEMSNMRRNVEESMNSEELPSIKRTSFDGSTKTQYSAKIENDKMSERNRKNAILARENRQKKKQYVEKLELENNSLKSENQELKTEVKSLMKEISNLKEETTYLKSVLAHQSTLSGLLKNIEKSNVTLTTSFKRQHYDEPEAKRFKNSTTSGGVCLHVSDKNVSLEFCAKCAAMAGNLDQT